MFEFLNQNQGAVSAFATTAIAILTLVYVVATVWLVRVSQRQAALAQKSIDVLGEAERNRYRPYVVFDIRYDGVVAFAALKNIGLSPALDVKLTIAPELRWQGDEDGVGFIDHGIALLAPGREIEEPCGAGKKFREAYQDLRFRGRISYSDGQRTFEEPFSIDLTYASRMKSIGKPDAAREMEKIAEVLQSITSGNFHPLIRVLNENEYPKYREELERRRSDATFRRIRAIAEASQGVAEEEQEPAEGAGKSSG